MANDFSSPPLGDQTPFQYSALPPEARATFVLDTCLVCVQRWAIGEFSVGNFCSDSLNVPQIYTTNKAGMGRRVSQAGEGRRGRVRGQGRWLDVVYLHLRFA